MNYIFNKILAFFANLKFGYLILGFLILGSLIFTFNYFELFNGFFFNNEFALQANLGNQNLVNEIAKFSLDNQVLFSEVAKLSLENQNLSNKIIELKSESQDLSANGIRPMQDWVKIPIPREIHPDSFFSKKTIAFNNLVVSKFKVCILDSLYSAPVKPAVILPVKPAVILPVEAPKLVKVSITEKRALLTEMHASFANTQALFAGQLA
jgi:hypothetical protein